MTTTTSKKIAIIGAGVIGLSWARLARDHGWQVAITDTSPKLQELVEAEFGANDPLVSWTADPDAAVRDADLVQENGPERLAIKQDIFSKAIKAAPARAVFATSSSSITATLIGEGIEDATRLVVGHPFNPPALMPLVEVVPGAKTSKEAAEQALALYRELGRAPVLIRKEIQGFVGNRLQVALSREAQYLVESGVISVKDLDLLLQNSLGLRWATIGLFEGNVLGGGPSGARHLFENVGAETGTIKPGVPSKDPAVVEKLVEDIEAAYGKGEEVYQELVAKRDRRTLAVLKALNETPERAEPAKELS